MLAIPYYILVNHLENLLATCLFPLFLDESLLRRVFNVVETCIYGLQITDKVTMPEVAFTGDTTADFIVDDSNLDALRAKILVMEVLKVIYSFQVQYSTYGTFFWEYLYIFMSKTLSTQADDEIEGSTTQRLAITFISVILF